MKSGLCIGLALAAVHFTCGAAQAAPEPCPEGYWCTAEPVPTLEPAPAERLPQVPPRRRQHAFSLRLGELFAGANHGVAGDRLTGLGLSYRVRPLTWLGIEPGVDLYRGYDGLSSSRSDTSIGTDLLLYANPRSAVQLFAMAGTALTHSRYSAHWAHSEATHLGVHAGVGMEFRVTHLVSFNVNAVAFSRRLTGANLRSSAGTSDLPLVPTAAQGLLLRASASAYF